MGASGLGFIGMFSQATVIRSPILNYGLTKAKTYVWGVQTINKKARN